MHVDSEFLLCVVRSAALPNKSIKQFSKVLLTVLRLGLFWCCGPAQDTDNKVDLSSGLFLGLFL